MPKYVADGTKQVAGPLPENSSDRITSPTRFTVTKTPNYITVTTDVVAADGIGDKYCLDISFEKSCP